MTNEVSPPDYENIKKSKWPYIFILAILCILPHYYGLFGEFISDDWPVIGENPYLKSPKHIPGFFTKDVWANSGLIVSSKSMYRPFFLLWNFLVFTFFGANPFAFHLSLLAIHLVNSTLVFILIGRLLPDSSMSERMLGSIFFGLHPSASHCISWIAGGTDIVLAFFLLASLLCYLTHSDKGKNIYFYFSLLLFFFALLTKETGATFLVPFVMTDLFKGNRLKELPFSRYIAYIFLFFVYLMARSAVVGKGDLFLSYDGLIRLFEYILLSFRYLLFPWNLPFYFEYPPDRPIVSLFDSAVGLFAIILFVSLVIRGKKYLYPIGWMVITFLPPLGIAFHNYGVFAVRFLYVPAIGLGIGAVLFAHSMKLSRNAITTFCALIAVVFTASNFYTSKDFANEKVFFTKVIQLNPQAKGGYIGLVSYYVRTKDFDSATKVLLNGLKTVTSNEIKITFYEKLGITYADQGKYTESISCYEEILKLSKNSASAYIGLGNNYWIIKSYDKALSAYYKAIEIEPKNFLALYNYASLLKSTGQNIEARKYYIKILETTPDPQYPQAIIEAKEFIGIPADTSFFQQH